MGYTTYFDKEFTVTKNKSGTEVPTGIFANSGIDDIAEFVNSMSKTRRMQRDLTKIADNNGFINGIPVEDFGYQGEFYFGELDGRSRNNDISVLDYNRPPDTQPGLWTHWVMEPIEKDAYSLKWDGGEKFYHYDEWLNYLVGSVFIPNNLVANGTVYTCGEDGEDRYVITIIENEITVSDYESGNDNFYKEYDDRREEYDECD